MISQKEPQNPSFPIINLEYYQCSQSLGTGWFYVAMSKSVFESFVKEETVSYSTLVGLANVFF